MTWTSHLRAEGGMGRHEGADKNAHAQRPLWHVGDQGVLRLLTMLALWQLCGRPNSIRMDSILSSHILSPDPSTNPPACWAA